MNATLQALGEILLKAVPTFLLVVFLHFYLKGVFFNPLERVLRRRYEATEGALKLAEEILQKAEAKSAEYEAAMRAARAEVYQAQEQLHKQIEEREAAALGAARASAEEAIRQAVAKIDAEAAAARAGLEQQSDALAGQIAESLLRRSAA
jgi:F-type H+-transporting ATPase subunit b